MSLWVWIIQLPLAAYMGCCSQTETHFQSSSLHRADHHFKFNTATNHLLNEDYTRAISSFQVLEMQSAKLPSIARPFLTNSCEIRVGKSGIRKPAYQRTVKRNPNSLSGERVQRACCSCWLAAAAAAAAMSHTSVSTTESSLLLFRRTALESRRSMASQQLLTIGGCLGAVSRFKVQTHSGQAFLKSHQFSKNCSPTVSPACPPVSGNVLIPGGVWVISVCRIWTGDASLCQQQDSAVWKFWSKEKDDFDLSGEGAETHRFLQLCCLSFVSRIKITLPGKFAN
jgi:hypothetical protein